MEQVEQLLKQSFEDYRLSGSEKSELRGVFSQYQHDNSKLSSIRNTAFAMAKAHLAEQSEFDHTAFKWLEQVVKTLDSIRVDAADLHEEAYFSPGLECKNKIISLIKQAQKSIDVCIFTLSDDDISDALLAAHQRGIDVRIITDNDKANDKGSDVDYLSIKGMAVIKDISEYHMHNKFAIIDNRWLINGSFNWTRSASRYNNENITVVNSPSLISRFTDVFEHLWREFS